MDGFELQKLTPIDPTETALTNAIRDNTDDLILTSISPNYVLSVENTDQLRDSMYAMPNDLNDFNKALAEFIGYKEGWKFFRVKPEGGGPYDEHEPYEFFKSNDSTVMIVFNVDKYKDKYATEVPPNPKLLHLSEILYQSVSSLSNLKHPATPQQIQDARTTQAAEAARLKYVWHFEVSNTATQKTIQQAYELMEWDAKSPRTFKRDSSKATEQKCFDALLRTVNVKPINRELVDHHRAFGNKKIQAITVVKRKGGGTKDNPFYLCNLIIEIGG